MKKKMKRVSMETSPPYVDEEVKNTFKYQNLIQDFYELQKETEAMSERLQKTKQKKLSLIAQVRFLRKRYKYLLKNQSPKIPSGHSVQPKFPNIRNQSSVKERNYSKKEVSTKSPPAIDLNQISIPKGEETEEFQVDWKPLRMKKKLKRYLAEGDVMTSDLKLLVCRDVGTGSSRPGKRKISWQDQVALKV